MRIVPTSPIDEAWHEALQRTEVYLPMILAFADSMIHHGPVMDDDIRSGAALARTIPYLKATGMYYVDRELWDDEAGSSCCPPECNDQSGRESLGSWSDLVPSGPLGIRF